MTTSANKLETMEMLQKHGQQHLLTFWDELQEGEKQLLMDDIQNIDFSSYLDDVAISKKRAATNTIKKVDDILEPPTRDVCGSWTDSKQQQIDRYNEIGLRSISIGECCVVLMAGGAGTRLGVNYPKGMYDVGLPSGKSLFQIQAERLIRLQNLAIQRFGEVSPIMWYIMTSDCTRDATLEYFAKNNYFGLSKDQVVYFEQFTLPIIGIDGKIILESKHRIAKSPDGNGGLYRALRNYKIVDDMKERGIKYVHVYGVDNILIKIADPIFFGFFIDKGAECAAKVVEKTNPKETVGVVAKVDGHYQIVEYTEIAKETTELLDPSDSDKLLYRFGSICSHLFRMDLLERVCSVESSSILVQHIALKAVPFMNTITGQLEKPEKINAIKIEKFVFDVFPLAKSFVIWETDRDQEFSPLKNPIGSDSNSPKTSKMSILKYHNYLVRSNLRDCENIKKAARMTFEISPLVTYRGEGLGSIDGFVEEAKEGSTMILELNDHNEMTCRRIENYTI